LFFKDVYIKKFTIKVYIQLQNYLISFHPPKIVLDFYAVVFLCVNIHFILLLIEFFYEFMLSMIIVKNNISQQCFINDV